MVACQLARSLGVERTVAMVNKSSYRQIYDLLGVDRAISPRVLCANHILRFVRSELGLVDRCDRGRAWPRCSSSRRHSRMTARRRRKVKNLGLPTRNGPRSAVVRPARRSFIPQR